MIETAAGQRDRATIGVEDAHAGLAGRDAADAGHGNTHCISRREHRVATIRRGSEREFVIVAAREHGGGALRERHAGERRRMRQPPPVEFDAAPGTLRDVAEVGDESVGHVDRTARDTGEREAEGDTRLGAFEASGETVGAPGPVLLVDDLATSRWTLTVVGRLLRRAGAPVVHPLVLATGASGSG